MTALASALALALAAGVVPAAAASAAAATGPVAQSTASADGGAGSGPAVGSDEALERAKKSGKSVEVLSERSETSEVFATPRGTLEARQYLRPVRARTADGWKDIDTDLVQAKDGTVAPKVATVDLRFSGGGNKVPLVSMTRAGRDMALTWPGKLPEPVLDGPTATYPEVLPGVDLRMGAQEDGFTQLLVVKTAQAADDPRLEKLRLALTGDGLEVRETSQGGLRAVDKGTGGTVFEAATPVMWDSSNGRAKDSGAPTAAAVPGARTSLDPKGNEPGAGESGKLKRVGVEVTSQRDELVLAPDQALLRGADTVYPVFIDPQFYAPQATAWTMASKYWASSPQWKFNGESDAGMGFCNWAYCQPNDTKRLFYQISVSAFAGKSVLSAEFVVRNTWSASCTDTSVELWETKGINASTTWNTQNNDDFWVKKLDTRSFAYGYSGCSAKDAEFNVKSAVQAAATAKKPTMTFGLQAASETDAYGWKRFSNKAFLRVLYNRPPPQVKTSQLTMEYGGTCKKPATPARVRTLGKISANNITDPDGDDVAVQFRAFWDAGDGKGHIARWKPELTTPDTSGSSFTIPLPSGVIPPDKQIDWAVRVWDGHSYSPWSYAGDPTACYFVYDTSVPKSPSISSTYYPESNPADPEDPWYDGVGKFGHFDVKAAETDVVKYWYGINGDPTPANLINTSAGALRTVSMLPDKPGLNFVTAQAFDSAGNGSEIRTYHFRVKAGQAERAMWQMDEGAGATAAAGTAGARPATLYGGPVAGAAGAKGTAVTFDGVDDYAKSDITPVSTDIAFSVSAWARLTQTPTGAAVVVAQTGNNAPGFELYYSKSYDRWVFNQYAADDANSTISRAMAPVPGGAVPGEWTHLVGVYDTAADQLRLYINGQLVGTTPYTSNWYARRGLQIGAGAYAGGKTGSYFPGDIDEIQVFDKALSADVVQRLYQKQATATGRPARMIYTMDDPAGATELQGMPEALDASFKGSPTPGSTGVAGKALTFDGVDDYATPGRPILNNQRSFSVSAWAKLPETKPTHTAAVASQAGTNRPAFELYYSSAYDQWIFNHYETDAADSALSRARPPAEQTAYANTWTHLVGVYDALDTSISLYINGVRAAYNPDVTEDWYGGGPFQIGASGSTSAVTSFFGGQIDDVRLFDRVVAGGEVVQLYQQRPEVKSRWSFETTEGTDPVTIPDSAGTGNALTLQGGATPEEIWQVDMGGLALDGTGYATAAKVPVDTSGSFTLTTWAQASAAPSKTVTVTSAEGANRPAFDVSFVPDPRYPDSGLGNWQLSVADKDGTDAKVVAIGAGEVKDVRDWTHLALVYDGFTKEARLYVDGALLEVACADDDGDGIADDAACMDIVPWAENAVAFKASSLQIGRSGTGSKAGSYFSGLVDDVWAFQGTLSDDQVRMLSGSFFDVPTQVPGT